MSLATWKKHFYPRPANTVPKEKALAHALRKWEGLTPNHLALHGLTKTGRHITDGDQHLMIDVTSCALCAHYYNEVDKEECEGCPLALVRDGYACDDKREDEDQDPWHAWAEDDDPKPMLALIRQAIREQT